MLLQRLTSSDYAHAELREVPRALIPLHDVKQQIFPQLSYNCSFNNYNTATWFNAFNAAPFGDHISFVVIKPFTRV